MTENNRNLCTDKAEKKNLSRAIGGGGKEWVMTEKHTWMTGR